MIMYRKAKEQDLPQVVKLSELWEAENATYGLRANSADLLKPFLGDYFWLAEKQGEIIGYITGSVQESEGLAVIEKGEKYLEIDEVYVLPDYRNRKVGHTLVDQLLQSAEAGGVTRSLVYSASKQWREIIGFYEKHGFKMWFVQMYR